MTDLKRIRTALISVYDKKDLEPILFKLNELSVKIISTGGTKEFIQELAINVTAVEDITSYPSILGGRLKTLHPKIFGGLLYRRGLQEDENQVSEYNIPDIDLVIVDLYPFEETVQSGASEQEIIEKIDVGGISLIRAAAKNYHDVLIVPSKLQYQSLLELLELKKGETSLEDRKKFALEGFNTSSHYDTAIYHYFANGAPLAFKQSYLSGQPLRYGENPHQEGYFFGNMDEMFKKLSGKEISYNNLLDIDAAVHLIDEFNETTFAILKHNNACGLASRPTVLEAWKDALAGDPVSAFGGILITNAEVDKQVAEEIHKLFFEVIIAPSFTGDGLELLMGKRNRIILLKKNFPLQDRRFRSVLNGVVVQDRDRSMEDESRFSYATDRKPTSDEIRDMIFANKIVKHTKSNAIVLAKDEQLVASGTGQTSRVDALKQAIGKAENFGFNLEGAVMASDAFFPFSDSVKIAYQSGIRAVIQPGGSKRDKDSIDFCNREKMAMVFTGVRHFKH